MRRFDYFSVGQQRFQGLRITPPEYCNERERPPLPVSTAVQRTDSLLGDLFPASVLVAVRSSCADGQGPVEQHDPLFHPRCEVTVRRCRHMDVIHKLFINVAQAARYGVNIRGDAEAQADRMPWGGVGVLPHNKDFDIIDRQLECTEYIAA